MTLLLLAGTAEARQLSEALAADGIAAVASLAGAVRAPQELALPTFSGGFGGAAGFEAFIEATGITAVLDATHPYAVRITARTSEICAARGIPYLRLDRPAWAPQPGDRWTMIDAEEDAAAHVPPGATVFLATGRQTLSRFANLRVARVICRQIEPPGGPFPFEGGEFLIGRPPFPLAAEVDLFRALAVDVLVVKNAGGTASRPKLDAARSLGLPVLMIRRPPRPAAPVVETIGDALDWARAQEAVP